MYPGLVKNDYIFLYAIGSGSYSSVWLANYREPSLRVAIKVIEKTPQAKLNIQSEVSINASLSDPFIIETFDSFEDEEFYYIVSEFAEGGNLLDYINNHGCLSETHAQVFFVQMIHVLEYLHETKGILHHDIKPENILLDRYGNIKLTDFGLAHPISQQQSMFSGSLPYSAPEVIQGNEYGTSSEIWSLGVILYSALTQTLPFSEDTPSKMLSKMLYTEINFPSNMSTAVIDLLKKMLERDYTKRIDLEEIKKHQWFSQEDFQNISYPELIEYEASIENTVISEIEKRHLDVEKTFEDLKQNRVTPETIVFKIIYRDLLSDKINQRISTPGEKIRLTNKLGFISNGNLILDFDRNRKAQQIGLRKVPTKFRCSNRNSLLVTSNKYKIRTSLRPKQY